MSTHIDTPDAVTQLKNMLSPNGTWEQGLAIGRQMNHGDLLVAFAYAYSILAPHQLMALNSACPQTRTPEAA